MMKCTPSLLVCMQVNTAAGHCQEDSGVRSDGGQDTDSEKSPLVNATT